MFISINYGLTARHGPSLCAKERPSPPENIQNARIIFKIQGGGSAEFLSLSHWLEHGDCMAFAESDLI
jgi:hypothetical protein